MKTIFISAYRNVSIRYILSTDIFKYLKNKDLIQIVIFVKKNDIEYFKNKYRGENIIFEDIFFEKATKQFRSRLGLFFYLIRSYMYGSKGKTKNNSPKIWGIIWSEQSKNSGFKRKTLFYASKLIAEIFQHFKSLRKSLVRLESILFNGNIYDDYFKKYNPELLITSSTGYMIDPLIMRAAKRNKSKILSIVHSWDNTTTKAYRGASLDYVVAWNHIMKNELNIFQDINKSKIHVGGVAHWDDYFNGSLIKSDGPFFKKEITNKTPKIIFYATSAPIMFKSTFDMIEDILIKIKNGTILSNCKLIVRLHPNYLSKQKGADSLVMDVYSSKIEELKERYGNLIEFNLPKINWIKDDYELPIEDIRNLGKLLIESDLLLTEYSTLMIEASIFDLPIINVALGKFRDTNQPISIIEDLNHLKRVLKTKATRQAYSLDELTNQINQYISNPQLDSDNRKKLVEQEITSNIGNAGKSIGKYIYNLIR